MFEPSPEALRKRTKQFALRVIRLFRALPKSPEAQVIGRQMLRSGTSVGANYRSACPARSKPEFAARVGIVAEEADETTYWMELLLEAGIMKEKQLADLIRESVELTKIFTAARHSSRE